MHRDKITRLQHSENAMADGEQECLPLAKIKVLGIGGAGNNAVNNMITSGLLGVEFIAANTDAQALRRSHAQVKIQLGTQLTRGLGAGGNPEVGAKATEEDIDKIKSAVNGSDMVFITAGLGGGTGTGGAPIVAKVCKELGVLTVAVVTKPFSFEGKTRQKNAVEGLARLQDVVDTLITIPNDRLTTLSDKRATFLEMLKKADDILYYAVKGISDLIIIPGYINVDFADVKTVMSEMGMALMGTGVAKGENRAAEAAHQAISSPLLEDISVKGAKAVLVNITSGPDLTMHEFEEASSIIHSEVDDNANIILGMAIDPEMSEELRVTVIATGIGKAPQQKPQPRRPEPRPATRSPSPPPAPTRTVKTEERIFIDGTQDIDYEELELPPLDRRSALREGGSYGARQVDDDTRKGSFFDRFKRKFTSDEDDDLTIPTFIRRRRSD